MLFLGIGFAPASASEQVLPADSVADDEGPSGVRVRETLRVASSDDVLRASPPTAAECSDPEGETVQVCVEQGTADQSRSTNAEVGTSSIVGLPEWCIEAGVSNNYSYTRTDVCGIFSLSLSVRQVVNGAPTGPVTGTMNLLVYNYIYTATDYHYWANQIEVQPTVVTGTAAGMTVSGTSFCTGNCVSDGTTFPTRPLTGIVAGESYYQWAGAAGQVGFGSPRWDLTFRVPSANNTAQYGRPGLEVRCDNAVPGRTVAGCVIPAYEPSLTYDASWVEFGQHIRGAQASGLPGSWYSNRPLHRLTDQALRDANRATACPASLPRPTGKSCDEYPFASTYEGAALSGGGPRTQPQCQVAVNGVPSSGPLGYSVCMIDENENSEAGSVLNSVLLAPYRVIDGDPYFVDAE